MYIARVIPLSKSIKKEELTYFTSKKIPLGSIVSVPVRSKLIDAIIIDIEEATNLKSDLKSSSFKLKKIEKVKGDPPYEQAFFQACFEIKNYVASTTGTVLNAMLPSLFIEKYSTLKKVKIPLLENKNALIKNEKLIFQALLEDRLSWYRTLIREAFAKKESVFICVPTNYDIEIFYNNFAKGIEQYVFKFHSDLSKKSIVDNYNKCINEEHAILIIGTGKFLSIPRHDVKTIIIEHEHSEAYKQIARPYIDIRVFAEVYASIKHIKIIFGDTLLRPETLYRNEINALGEVTSPLFRLPKVERQIIVDMKKEKDEKGTQTFQVLGQITKQMIDYAMEHNENVFLFTVRKGLAGITVCHDCGNTLLCDHCNAPVVLYNKKNKEGDGELRIFMCNKCGHKKESKSTCPKCNSWNLTPLGIGTDRVVSELKKLYLKENIVQIDKETTNTDKEMKNACESFYNKAGSILVGTEMAFSCLRESITHSAIISLDGLLSIPSFNINQKILHLIEKLHSLTDRNLIIQTRIPENIILKHILSGNVLPIFREDLEERKIFNYPPFKKLIKITFKGSARDSTKAKDYLSVLFADFDPQVFSAFTNKVKGEYIINTVIKIDPKIWPIPPVNEIPEEQKVLLEKLLSLPPSFSINIDPEDLL